MNLSSDRIQVPVALRRHGGRSRRRGFTTQFAKMPRWVKISVKESKKNVPALLCHISNVGTYKQGIRAGIQIFKNVAKRLASDMLIPAARETRRSMRAVGSL